MEKQQEPVPTGQPMQMQQPMQVVMAPAHKPPPFESGRWPSEPIQVECPNCGKQGITKCEGSVSMMAWILCIVLCCIGCNLGCCLIPFCIKGCKNHKHTCEHCNNVIGYQTTM